MAITAQNLKTDFGKIIATHGTRVRFRYFTVSGAITGYDDQKSYAKSGSDLWTSGLFLPLDNSRGSTDAGLVEQGRLLINDSKLYLDSNIQTSGIFQVGIGSPIIREYKSAEAGTIVWGVNGSDVYKKVYLTHLTGSFA